MIKNPITRVRSMYIAAGILLLLCGYGLYLAFRWPGGTVLHTWFVSQFLMRTIPHSAAHAQWVDWIPSFIYVLAFSLISAGMLGGRGTRSRYAVPVFWMMVVSAFEVGQYFHVPVSALVPGSWAAAPPVCLLDNYFRLGTFDPLDLAAGFGGMLVAIFVLALTREKIPIPAQERRQVAGYLQKAGGFAVFLIGIACLLATSTMDYCDYEPIYLSYSDLRKPVTAAAPEALSKSGKIYVYGNLILFNERNRGIHVLDNTNPAAPLNAFFLPVPGNIDIAVKDNILYADSYIDLVAIDISVPANSHEVNRVQSVFPYDPYQIIAGQEKLRVCYGYDETQGVIVGYRLKKR